MGSIAEKQETLDDWDAHSMGPLRRVKAADHGRARRGGEGEGKSGPGRSPRAAHRRPRRLPANERAALQRVLCDRVWGAERSGMKDAFQSHNNNETKLSTGETDEREREPAGARGRASPRTERSRGQDRPRLLVDPDERPPLQPLFVIVVITVVLLSLTLLEHLSQPLVRVGGADPSRDRLDAQAVE